MKKADSPPLAGKVLPSPGVTRSTETPYEMNALTSVVDVEHDEHNTPLQESDMRRKEMGEWAGWRYEQNASGRHLYGAVRRSADLDPMDLAASGIRTSPRVSLSPAPHYRYRWRPLRKSHIHGLSIPNETPSRQTCAQVTGSPPRPHSRSMSMPGDT